MWQTAGDLRMSLGRWLLMTLIVAAPRAGALASEEPAAQATATVNGHITDESGAALAGVRVLVAVPAADMRFVYRGTGHKTFETQSDGNGDYELTLPEVAKPTEVSLNASKPGYRTLVGMLMQSGDRRQFEVVPGGTSTQSFTLPAAAYIRGTVVDKQGKPVAGVHVNANLKFALASGGVQLTATEEDGTFEIFNFPRPPFADKQFTNAQAVLYLDHPEYVDYRANDLYVLPPEQQANLQIALDSGHSIAGRVTDADGRNVAGVMVEATSGNRKAVLTSDQGTFTLRGLMEGSTKIRVHAARAKQQRTATVELNRDIKNLELRLQPIVLMQEPETVQVLGMTLADVTPELAAAYDLRLPQGALILDPGKDSARLKIGQLVEGYTFFMAGKTRVANVREFLTQILAESEEESEEIQRCRVVYTFRDLENTGTNTQYLKLTEDDLREVQKVLDQMKQQ